MADLASLVSAFTGQASQPSAPDMPWQQQLLQQVDPETARRRNIANALQKASAALATTPGDFLTGLSSAAVSGSGEYLQGRDANDMKRIEAMRAIEQANTAQKDRDLSRLRDAIGVQSTAENTAYGRERDKVADSRWTQEQDYRKTQDQKNYDLRKQQIESMDAYRRQRNEIASAKAGIDTAIGVTPSTKGMLTANQRNTALTAINRFAIDFEKRRIDEINQDYSIPDEERPARLAAVAQEKEAFKRSLMQEYQLATPHVQNPAAPTTPGASGKTDMGGAPARIGTKEQYDALPSGSQYVAPDGTIRNKP